MAGFTRSLPGYLGWGRAARQQCDVMCVCTGVWSCAVCVVRWCDVSHCVSGAVV